VRRLPAATTLALLLLALAVAMVVVVPWTPLPGAEIDPDPARDFTAVERAREMAFHAMVRPSTYTSLVMGLVLSVVLALTPLGARLVTAVARPLGGGWVWQVVLGTLALAVVGRLATLPLGARVEAARRDYGLSTRTWVQWGVDLGKGVLVGAALTAVLVLVLVAVARALPGTWWAWGAGATAALVVVISFAYPVVVEPVFNRFTPLPAGELRDDLLVLADRDGVPVSDVLVADASRRTSSLNAYVSGFGSTRRIVVYDNLLKRATPEEVALVVAHELGHAKQRDVLTGTLLAALGAAAAVCGLFLVLSWPPLLARAGAAGAGDPRVVPLVLALLAVGSLVTAPVSNLVSRRVEARADVSALDLTRDPTTFLEAQKRLARANLSDLEPHPVPYVLFATHPSPTQRLAMAREWERLRG
jgi:STE24 endopeptidase